MATATYKAAGNRVDYTASGSDTSAGEVVVLSTMIGIATQLIEENDKGSLAIGGIFSMPKPTGTGGAINQGDAVYWDGTEVTEESSGTNYLGKCAAEAAESDSTVDVLINVNE